MDEDLSMGTPDLGHPVFLGLAGFERDFVALVDFKKLVDGWRHD
jgi:hypothetical protein